MKKASLKNQNKNSSSVETPSQKKPFIEFDQASFSYGNEKILENITASIYPEELVSVIGPNGSGKTTFLRLILGFLQPTAGKVAVFRHYPELSMSRIGYVPQHLLYDPAFPVTVMDVVLMGRVKRGLQRITLQDRKAAGNVLSRLGLEEFADRGFQDLSGGQRQRALIARALAGDPVLLLLDEPTASIDRETEAEIYGLIRALASTMAVVLVSHDLGVVPRLSNRIMCLNRDLAFHETSALTGEDIQDMYQCGVELVHHHDHHQERNR
ncbi:MAG: metal ABC transporter ATP-binding protein [Spirochaetaceae bacterium]|nr:MAG: metal ABC transporter ATP-binding protein [Spirochaetaceae bacterium]